MSSTKRPAPLTEEERKNQIARFFTQKREAFATGILYNLCQGIGQVPNPNNLVDQAVEMADHLIDKLYPVLTEKEEGDE